MVDDDFILFASGVSDANVAAFTCEGLIRGCGGCCGMMDSDDVVDTLVDVFVSANANCESYMSVEHCYYECEYTRTHTHAV
jgi:hypothetical protein